MLFWTVCIRGLVILSSLGLLLVFSLTPMNSSIPIAAAQSTHALPLRTEPVADAVLNAPPQRVHIWFSEQLFPPTSRIIVVDTTNREVDNKDSQVSNANELNVTVPLLPSGTYVVVWRSQSATDGHIASGSFIFRIARPDGTVPPIPSVLPTGNVPGAAGSGISSNGNLDNFSLVQTVMDWLALLFMTLWIGGLLWETWILPPEQQSHPDLALAARQGQHRFRRIAPYTLLFLLVANTGSVLGQAAELAGDWSGAFSWPLLRVLLFESRFGLFWWMREGVVFLALVFLLFQRQRERFHQQSSLSPNEVLLVAEEVPSASWWQAVRESFFGIRNVPHRLVQGWQKCGWERRLELLLALCLLLAFALSGHAAAVPNGQLWYSLSSDLFHLLGDTAWLGGLLYIGCILVPTLFSLEARQRARILSMGLPAFSAFAIITVVVLAVTGSLNTTVHLTSLNQFVTTLYGRTLLVKSVLFVFMAVISAYHAFFLRPRLMRTLAQEHVPSGELALVSKGTGTQERLYRSSVHDESEMFVMHRIQRQTKSLATWLQIEAVLGVSILLCVALLTAFSGTLVSTPPVHAGPGKNAHTPFVQTLSAHGYSLTLQVAPLTFGTNTFVVTLHDAQGQPVSGAGVLLETQMLDMDMGVQTQQLPSVSPGTYKGQSDLTMEGHWRVIIRVLPPKQNTFVRYTFTFSAL